MIKPLLSQNESKTNQISPKNKQK